MKTDKIVHNLGSDWRPNSQHWYHLIVEDSGHWSVVREVDYDAPGKDPQESVIPHEDIKSHSIDGVPLSEAIDKKLAELGI